MTIAWSVDTQGLCLKTDLFSDLPYRSYVSGENGPQKRNFSKMLSRVEIFEIADFSLTCGQGQTKTQVFELYDDVIHHVFLAWRMFCKEFYCISNRIFMWTGESDSNMLHVDEYFWKMEKRKYPFSKIPRYLWMGQGRVFWCNVRREFIVAQRSFCFVTHKTQNCCL